MKKIGILLLSLLLVLELRGQDFHFSQFYSGPLNLNPALTGSSELSRSSFERILKERKKSNATTVFTNTYYSRST
jgi:hypothetical protein